MQRREICGVDVASYVIHMEEFHGYRSPGMLIGGVMIENGMTQLGHTPYLNVVCETVVCLPDAVQLLTPCTLGNGFLQVLDWGKFSLTAYDRQSLEGVRIWLSPDGLSDYPLISGWFQRTGEKEINGAIDWQAVFGQFSCVMGNIWRARKKKTNAYFSAEQFGCPGGLGSFGEKIFQER